jgi:hypothetical protein
MSVSDYFDGHPWPLAVHVSRWRGVLWGATGSGRIAMLDHFSYLFGQTVASSTSKLPSAPSGNWENMLTKPGNHRMVGPEFDFDY